MKKAVVFGILMLATGFILWQLVEKEFVNPAEELVTKVDKENFKWFTCSGCGNLFMAEATTRKGYCPYCGLQTMLVTETKRVVGTSVDESEFVCFFSPECGKVFFAYETGEMGTCPYCGEAVSLVAPETIGPERRPPEVIAWAEAHFGGLVAGISGLLVATFAVLYIVLQSRIILSLTPVAGPASERTKIDLSKWKTRKKKITVGDAPDSDIVLEDPSLKDTRCTLSFVRVGGTVHAYLSRSGNQPVWINEKPQYNPRLHNRDKVKLGDIIFEVKTREK
jgi:DNA-directed RNA polymerase subunit RPC12/RpoP